MSFLQMTAAPIDDMNSAIVSVWFRAPDKPHKWTNGPPDPFPVPPPWPLPSADPYMFDLPIAGNYAVFWSPYGKPPSSLFPIWGTPEIILPYPPPMGTEDMSMIMTFGDSKQPYKHRPWAVKKMPVMDAMDFYKIPFFGFQYEHWPPPYAPNNGNVVPIWSVVLGGEEVKQDVVPQSFIGVKDDQLWIVLQTKDRADYKGYLYLIENMHALMANPTDINLHPDGTHDWRRVGEYLNGYECFWEDRSTEWMGQAPEQFLLGPFPISTGWNHLLLSFEIGGREVQQFISNQNTPTMTTTCKAWVAINDFSPLLQRRPSTTDMPPEPSPEPQRINDAYFRSQYGPGFNNSSDLIIPRNVWLYGYWGVPKTDLIWHTGDLDPYGFWCNRLYFLYDEDAALPILDPVTAPDPKTFANPTYKCTFTGLPTANQPIGLPSIDKYVERGRNKHCEMAELQVWVNQSMDFSKTENRRLFIDDDRKPADMSVAEQILGPPTIKLHGSSNWKAGYNTGSSGIQIDGEGKQHKIPQGQFMPTAEIRAYKPEPEVGK